MSNLFVLNSSLPSPGEAGFQGSLCLVSDVLQRCDFDVSRPTWVDFKADILAELKHAQVHSCRCVHVCWAEQHGPSSHLLVPSWVQGGFKCAAAGRDTRATTMPQLSTTAMGDVAALAAPGSRLFCTGRVASSHIPLADPRNLLATARLFAGAWSGHTTKTHLPHQLTPAPRAQRNHRPNPAPVCFCD